MPRWSLGCQACRQRRIGCDAALPTCRQCLLGNRWCSGPIQGPIILDETRAVMTRHQGTSKPSTRSKTLAMSSQPSPKVFISMALVSHFVYFIATRNQGPSNRPWLHELGDVSRGEARPTLDLALQAAATAFCGVNSKNYTVLMEACQLYGQALSRYISAMSRPSEEPTVSKICTSALLSLFEAIWPTNSVSYFVHLTACWKMLASMGTEPEHIAILRQVAVHVQHQSLFAVTAAPRSHRDSILDECNWAGLPWFQADNYQPVVDKLVVELFGLQKVLSRNHSRDDAIASYTVISSRINNLWVEYQAEQGQWGAPIEFSSHSSHQYPDAVTAFTMAYFSAAWILLSCVRLSVVDCPDTDPGREINSQRVLNCFSYLSQKRRGWIYLRMCAPLTIVALQSPSSEQRALAYTILDSSFYRAIFTGLSSSALWRIQTVQSACQNC
ncbi:hypothetical protein BGZ63DRAFT_397598 [Mariannaea sp. PMI_226]|nr:hypothetical protein BGZ63DRAFT_397598 [Mariannaea sp. PMI_226]